MAGNVGLGDDPSIPKLMGILKTAIFPVQEFLINREEKLKVDIERLKKENDVLRLDKVAVEAENEELKHQILLLKEENDGLRLDKVAVKVENKKLKHQFLLENKVMTAFRDEWGKLLEIMHNGKGLGEPPVVNTIEAGLKASDPVLENGDCQLPHVKVETDVSNCNVSIPENGDCQLPRVKVETDVSNCNVTVPDNGDSSFVRVKIEVDESNCHEHTCPVAAQTQHSQEAGSKGHEDRVLIEISDSDDDSDLDVILPKKSVQTSLSKWLTKESGSVTLKRKQDSEAQNCCTDDNTQPNKRACLQEQMAGERTSLSNTMLPPPTSSSHATAIRPPSPTSSTAPSPPPRTPQVPSPEPPRRARMPRVDVVTFLKLHLWGRGNTAEEDSPTQSQDGSHSNRQWSGSLGPVVGATSSTTWVPLGRKAPRIRSKEKADQDNITLAALLEKGKKKRGGRRGIVTTSQSEKLVNAEGKIMMEWDADKGLPICKTGVHRLVMDIGSIVRDCLPMTTKFDDLDTKGRLALWTQLTCLYDFAEENAPLLIYIEKVAKKRYKDWKNECKDWWAKYTAEELKQGRSPYDDIPEEFLARPEDWKWLLRHWVSPEHIAKSNKCKAARAKNELKTRGGSRPMHEYVEAYKTCKTSESLTPHINARLRYFPADDPHSPTRIRGQKLLTAQEEFTKIIVASTLAKQEPEVDGTSPSSVEKDLLEIEAITKAIGQSNGQFQTGVEKVMVRQVRDVGGSFSSASSESSQKVDELTRQLVEENRKLAEQQELIAALAEERKRDKKTQEDMAKQLDYLTHVITSQGPDFCNRRGRDG